MDPIFWHVCSNVHSDLKPQFLGSGAQSSVVSPSSDLETVWLNPLSSTETQHTVCDWSGFSLKRPTALPKRIQCERQLRINGWGIPREPKEKCNIRLERVGRVQGLRSTSSQSKAEKCGASRGSQSYACTKAKTWDLSRKGFAVTEWP